MFAWLHKVYVYFATWIHFLVFTVYGFKILYNELDIPFKIQALLGLAKAGKLTNARIPLNELLDTTKGEFEKAKLQGKITQDPRFAIITGANAGIGLETAKSLADVGYNIVLACRSLERGKEAVEKLKHHISKRNINIEIKLMQCDLGSFASVSDFVKKVKDQKIPVNLLVCNAGVMTPPLGRTKEGYETQLGSNYLAHFLMVQLLLSTLKKYGPSRIVIVSSEAHRTGYLNWDDINSEKYYNAYLGYSQSKVCLIMFCYELHRYLREHKSDFEDLITVNVLHPGVIVTNIAHNVPFPVNHLFDWFMPFLGLKPTEGCVTTVYCCISPELDGVSGKYFDHCQPKRSLESTYDKDEAHKLWKWSISEITRFVKEI